jgi:hypothetical protein
MKNKLKANFDFTCSIYLFTLETTESDEVKLSLPKIVFSQTFELSNFCEGCITYINVAHAQK